MSHTALKVALLAAATLATGGAFADKHRYNATNETWRNECGSCHLAYPPALLPASSWRAVMDGLSKHFGSDASLDPQAHAEVAAFLERNAGRDRDRAAKPALRISETRWFRHEHDEVPPGLWKSDQVKSAANCAACHRQAEAGDYEDDSIRLPR